MRFVFPESCRGAPLPLQQVHFVFKNGFAVPEERDDDSEPHRGFGGGIGDDEQRENLPCDVAVQARKGHEIDVHGVQNQLLATSSEFGGNLSAGTALRTGTPWPGIFLLDHSIRPTCAASAREMSKPTHFCLANCN